MGFDILMFGLKMKGMNAEYWKRIDAQSQGVTASKPDHAELFAWPGIIVLVAIVALLIIGWCLVAAYAPGHPVSSAAPLKG
jgi:hypothetical protein